MGVRGSVTAYGIGRQPNDGEEYFVPPVETKIQTLELAEAISAYFPAVQHAKDNDVELAHVTGLRHAMRYHLYRDMDEEPPHPELFRFASSPDPAASDSTLETEDLMRGPKKKASQEDLSGSDRDAKEDVAMEEWDGGAAGSDGEDEEEEDADEDADGESGVVKANKGMILRKSVEYIRYV